MQKYTVSSEKTFTPRRIFLWILKKASGAFSYFLTFEFFFSLPFFFIYFFFSHLIASTSVFCSQHGALICSGLTFRSSPQQCHENYKSQNWTKEKQIYSKHLSNSRAELSLDINLTSSPKAPLLALLISCLRPHSCIGRKASRDWVPRLR